MVVVHALGECVIRTSVATITPRADIGFALAMYLIAQRGKRTSRQTLLALFWPTAPQATAAHALSEALHKLRRKGLPVCGDDTYCVWIARDAVSTDIEGLRTQPPRTLLQRDLTILPGYSPRGSASFLDWLDDYRDEFRQQLIAELLNATARAEDDGDARTVMELAEQLLKLEPSNEAALAATAHAAEALRRPATPRRTAPALGDEVRPQVVSESMPSTRWSLPVGDFPAARDTTLVGRADDVALIIDLLDAAARGSGGGLFISGAAGIGKSRLVRALGSIARERGMVVASVACQQSDLLRPLSAFVDIVPEVRLLPGAAGASPSMIPYLDRLTKHAAKDYASDVEAGEMEHSYGCIQHAVFDLLESVSDEQPLVLVIENIQWLDPASWALLCGMSAWATGRAVVFALTSRDQWNTARGGEPPTALRLHSLLPLTDAAAAEHAAEYANVIGHVPSVALLDWCISASEGNPYLVEELLNHWVATHEQFATPRSLTALLDARLERLTPMALSLLKTCAVMGRNSTLSRIERLLEQPPYELFGALEDLGAAGMLTTERDEEGSGNNRVLCRHDVLAQAAISRIPPVALELLHTRAGLVLEAELDGPDSASLLWDCAGHWHAAGNSTRAVELGRSCIGHLLEIGLAHDAAEGCRRTLTFCTRNSDKLDVLTTLAQILHLTRSWTELFAVIDTIRALQSSANLSFSQHDDLELLALDADWHANRDWSTTLRRVQRCSMAHDAEPKHRVRAGVIALKLATSLGQTPTMQAIYSDLMPVLGDETVDPADRLMFEMIFNAVCGSADACIKAAEELLAGVGEIPELQRLCIAVNCASALFRAGAVSKAEHAYGATFVRALELGASAIAVETCTKVAATYLDVNDIGSAEVWTRRNLALSASVPNAGDRQVLRFALARIELHKGNSAAADHLLYNEGKPLWDDPVDVFRAAALATKLRIELASGDINRVADLVALLAPLSDRLRRMGSQDFETLSLFCGLRAAGELGKADRLLTVYMKDERRDLLPLSAEIAAEIAGIAERATGSERDEA